MNILQINHQNIAFHNTSRFFDWVLFDSFLACNLKCVYCHNPRFDEKVSLSQFSKFLQDNVKAIKNFQFGCAMEPTMDKRLIDFVGVLGGFRVRPTELFQIQTNGTLLHKLDLEALTAAGVNSFSISIDSMNPETHRVLRGGSDLNKITHNIQNLRKECPNIIIRFITTVSNLNYEELDKIVEFGLTVGVSHFNFRKMFYFKGSNMVNDEDMKKLVISQKDFGRVTHALRKKYPKRYLINRQDATELEELRLSTDKNSYPSNKSDDLAVKNT